jgi:tripartite-type tricarboxylate transporter receptor subunit TctC
MLDVIGGHTQLLMNSYLASVPHVRSGKLRALGVSDTKRTALLPDVPTIAEAGVPGYQAANWWGIAAPAGTPQPIVDRLYTEIAKILKSADMQERLAGLGMEASGMPPAEFTTFQKAEIEKWARVVKAANVKID